MILMKISKMSLWVVLSLGAVLYDAGVRAVNAQSLPFETTPDGFQTYLNNIKEWQGADTIAFENPKQCQINSFSDSDYGCRFDYTKYSALGQQTCIDNRVWVSTSKPNSPENPYLGIIEGECGKWQKVEELPLVGLTEQEVKEHDEYEQKNAKPKKSPVPGTSNLSIFAALLIASFSGAAIFAVIQKVLNKSNKDKT